MTNALYTKKCIPCEGGVPPLSQDKVRIFLREIEEWELNKEGHLEKTFTFSNFKKTMAFANKVADIAEEQGHHPDLHIKWGSCSVEIWTHKIEGLTESDFILAAKIDYINK